MTAAVERAQLRHLSQRVERVRLREPRGSDEIAVEGVDTRAAVRLLERLLDGADCHAAELSASDRDALLATLHRALWGDRIISSLRCEACGGPYDLAFQLSDLQQQLYGAAAAAARVEAPRTLVAGSGERVLLPDADGEQAAAEQGMQAGATQLLTSIFETEIERERASSLLEALAPLLDVDLATSCAECGQAARAHFDLQSFVLQRLLDERQGLIAEVHTLATGYGWSLQEILSLPRSLRRSFAARLEG